MDDKETLKLAAESGREATGCNFHYKKNRYKCEPPSILPNGARSSMPFCEYEIITIDRDVGVTPFLTKCEKCGGLMRSFFIE